MRIKRLFLVMTLLLISIGLFGCNGETGDSNKKVTDNSNNAAAVGEKVTLPEDNPAMVGKVKEIIGNEVTVYIMEVDPNAALPPNAEPKPPGQEQGQNPEQNLTKEQNQNKDDNPSQEADNNRTRPENRGAGMQFSEKTETFIIPVGTPIVMMQRGSGESTTVALTEIKKDQILRVWKKDDVVSFVSLMGGMGNRASGNREGAGGNDGPGFGNGPMPGGGMGGPGGR